MAKNKNKKRRISEEDSEDVRPSKKDKKAAKTPMRYFLLKGGKHYANGKVYSSGDTVPSPEDLTKKHSTKFTEVTKPLTIADVVEEDDEEDDEEE